MMNSWTNEDVEAILIQLNKQNLPFSKYEFIGLGEGLSMLGTGASANVYEVIAKGKKKKRYAVKVIGFNNKHIDTESFRDTVHIQTSLGIHSNNIVKIYDFIELRVWIEGEHNVVKAEKVDPYEETKPKGSFLQLQFVLMEKLVPVFISGQFKRKLTLHKLEMYNEKEIIKFAYDIGTALDNAHKRGVIHRDVKLENVFYDLQGECYKLGDFGIARTTDNGLASTIAFTKGYGAPEVVGTLEDKYDCTADIYSFGMMLYILLNELRFPESENYHPNVYQYTQGYTPPEPINGSDKLVRVVLKMINFNPDDRYQTVEEILNELDQLKYSHRVKYQREHKSGTLVLGTTFTLIGSSIWKLSFSENAMLDFSIWTYIFLTLCLVKYMLNIFKKKTTFVNMTIFVTGVYLLISSNFSWWKFLFLIIAVISGGVITGALAGGAITANFTYIIMQVAALKSEDYYEYRWLAVLLLTLGVFLLFAYCLLSERDEQITKIYLKKNIFWSGVTLYYVLLSMMEWNITAAKGWTFRMYEYIFGRENLNWVLSWNPQLVGIYGMLFCFIWVSREWLLILWEKRLLKKEMGAKYLA